MRVALLAAALIAAGCSDRTYSDKDLSLMDLPTLERLHREAVDDAAREDLKRRAPASRRDLREYEPRFSEGDRAAIAAEYRRRVSGP